MPYDVCSTAPLRMLIFTRLKISLNAVGSRQRTHPVGWTSNLNLSHVTSYDLKPICKDLMVMSGNPLRAYVHTYCTSQQNLTLRTGKFTAEQRSPGRDSEIASIHRRFLTPPKRRRRPLIHYPFFTFCAKTTHPD